MNKLQPNETITVGFGYCYLLKNGQEVWNQDDHDDAEWHSLDELEAIASKDPSARYLLIRDGVRYSEIYERFETGWIQIRRMLGFADDESAYLFQAELQKVKAEKTLTFCWLISRSLKQKTITKNK